MQILFSMMYNYQIFEYLNMSFYIIVFDFFYPAVFGKSQITVLRYVSRECWECLRANISPAWPQSGQLSWCKCPGTTPECECECVRERERAVNLRNNPVTQLDPRSSHHTFRTLLTTHPALGSAPLSLRLESTVLMVQNVGSDSCDCY